MTKVVTGKRPPQIVRVVARVDGIPVVPPPPPSTRDAGGCFAGCRIHGCAMTRCREFRAMQAQIPQWYWEVVEA